MPLTWMMVSTLLLAGVLFLVMNGLIVKYRNRHMHYKAKEHYPVDLQSLVAEATHVHFALECLETQIRSSR